MTLPTGETPIVVMTHETPDSVPFEKQSTRDKIKGVVAEVKGAIKEQAGSILQNARMEQEGNREKLSGRGQHKSIGQSITQ